MDHRLACARVLAVLVAVAAGPRSAEAQPAAPQPSAPPAATAATPAPQPTAPAAPPSAYPAPPPGYGAYPAPWPPPAGWAPQGPYVLGAPYAVMVPPEELPYREGAPVPPGYHVETRIRRKMVIGGGVTLAATWAFSAVMASVVVQYDSRVAPLYVPVVGPFIAIGTSAQQLHASDRTTVSLLYAIDGLAQTAGLALLIAGIAAKETVLLYGPPTTATAAPRPELLVGPGSASLRLRF
jgi:hypothetical protein